MEKAATVVDGAKGINIITTHVAPLWFPRPANKNGAIDVVYVFLIICEKSFGIMGS